MHFGSPIDDPRGLERRLLPCYSLDHLLIAGRRHLESVLCEFVEHYQEARPHQGLGQRTPSGGPVVARVTPAGRIERRDRLVD